MDEDLETVWQYLINSIPTRADIPQFFVGTFTGVDVVYSDAEGKQKAVPLDEIACRDVLNPKIPRTWFAVWNGTMYALSPVIPVT